MIPHTVASVKIDVKCREVPDLDHGKRAYEVGKEHALRHIAVFGVMQKGIIPPDHIDKDQVIDQLKILDAFLCRRMHMRGCYAQGFCFHSNTGIFSFIEYSTIAGTTLIIH